MPTYEYACKSCGSKLEVVQSFSDEPLTECPSCSGPLRKVFGSVGITFKGSGFYKTDSRSSSTATKAPASGDGGAKDGGSKDSGSKESSSSDSSSSSSSSTETAKSA